MKVAEDDEEKDARRQAHVVCVLSEVIQTIKNIYLRCLGSMRNKVKIKSETQHLMEILSAQVLSKTQQ